MGACAAGYGAYRTNQSAKQRTAQTAAQQKDPLAKSEVITALNSLVQKLDTAWEDFMKDKQIQVRSAISQLPIEEEAKQTLQSKIYTYEIIDVELLSLINIINAASEDNLQQAIASCQDKLQAALDTTVRKQKSKYDSLLAS